MSDWVLSFIAVWSLMGGCYLLGRFQGKRAAYREWLLALLDEEPLDFDSMLASILQSIQDEKSA